ncbi:MOSC domain-containing protein [Bradyrhizobium icense]|uniref:MOSC domain-containing protein n=1 Tax=Bradyrhizobium icense TaxID=1274631 RepID=UPI003AAAFC13
MTAAGHELKTAIRKRSIDRAALTTVGIVGDESSESVHHTLDRALHIFPLEHYPVIERRLEVRLPRPAFGENLSAHGLLEETVFVGHRLRIGRTICVLRSRQNAARP